MSLESYIPSQHEPYVKSVADLYREAHRELAIPYPAIPLKDFPQLTKMIGGLRGNEFTILCGATGTGKTTLCANLSRDLMKQGIRHLVLSVETGHTDFIKRVISSLARKDWNTGDPVPVEDLESFHKRHGEHFVRDTLYLSLYDNRLSVEALMADLAWMVKHKGIKVAVIDNLSFILETTRDQDAICEMDRVIHELIIFCKRIDIHVVMVMHPKKTENGRVESEFDVKGSSTAVQEAHNILLFNRPHPDLIKSGTAELSDREIMIAKIRRRGKFVRHRLLLKSQDGVSYLEGVVV